jgi:acetylornithine deacetylase/succinyl-diaminopimelate desuccinylase-like protein
MSGRVALRPAAAGLAAALALAGGGATPAQTLSPERIAALTEEHADAAFALYRDLLALPNDAHHPDDLLRVIEWLERAFAERGFAVERLEMPGSDALLATREAPGAGRKVLVYLQADGQPVDPAAWSQASPWTPVLKERDPEGGWREISWERLFGPGRDGEWRVFARSAADSKGPIAQFLTALSLLDAAGAPPGFDLQVIVDTEEELGSPHLAAAVERYRDRLAADLLVIFDGPPHVSGEPTLTFGARGIADLTLTVYGPRTAQHSGHWGNWVPNPVFGLARILASMKDADGRVTLPGFYDGVAIDEQTRQVLEAVPDHPEANRRGLGIAASERVAPSREEALQYPSLNVRGVAAGWIGEQARTIIPPTAIAELDLRLVAESDPERLIGLVRRHLEGLGYQVLDREPTDEERLRHPLLARLDSRIAYRAFRTDLDALPGRWLGAALTRLYGEPPARLRTAGGSIPIAPFVATLGVPAVQVGTVNPDNNQHAPDENLRVADFLRGIRMMAAILDQPLPAE